MDPVEAWIDVAELRRLAQRLMAPPRAGKKSVAEESPFGEINGVQTEAAPAAITQVALAEVPAAQPVASIFEPVLAPEVIEEAGSSLAQGISTFRRWLGERFKAKGLFLLDASGETIVDETGNDWLRGLAKDWVGNTSLKGETYVQIKISAEDVLGLFVRESAAGPLIHGVVLPKALLAAEASELRAKMPTLP